MDVDLDRPIEDDTMEYEEDGEEPSAGIEIEGDATLEEVLRDDEVMGMDPILPSEGGDEIGDDDIVEADAEAEDGGMEPEPTPALHGSGDQGPDPFLSADGGNGSEQPSTNGDAGLDPRRADDLAQEVATERVVGGATITDQPIRNDDPLPTSPEDAADTNGQPGTQQLSASSPQIKGQADESAAQVEAAEPGQNEGDEYDEAEEAEDEEYYEEDQEGDVAEAGPEGGEHPREAAIKQNHPEAPDAVHLPEQSTAGEAGLSTLALAKGSIDADDDNYDLDEMLTVHTLPDIILHLPDQPPKCLFFAITPDAEGAQVPDGISGATPVWLEDRHEELAQVPLAKLLEVVRAQVEMDKKGKREGKEMILEERGLGLKLGDHDRYLSEVTLLEYLQVHQSCLLPTPVQFFVSFHEARFWDRFAAIRKELVSIAEKEKLGPNTQGRGSAEEDGEEEYGEEDDEAIPDEGYASEDDVESQGDHDTLIGNKERDVDKRRIREDDAQAEYGGSQADDSEKAPKKVRIDADSAHPHADWARTLPTEPLAFGVGARGSANFKARDTATLADATTPPEDKGRSRGVQVYEGSADTEQSTSSNDKKAKTKMIGENGRVPLDAVAMHDAQVEDASRVERDRAQLGLTVEDAEGQDLAAEVPLDEVALKYEREREEAESSLTDDLGTATPSANDPNHFGSSPMFNDTGRPLGDVELMQDRGAASLKVPSLINGKLQEMVDASETTSGTSTASTVPPGLLTPPLSEPSTPMASTKPAVGSSLANEVEPDASESYFSTIPEEGDLAIPADDEDVAEDTEEAGDAVEDVEYGEEYDEDGEDAVEGDGEEADDESLGVDVNGIIDEADAREREREQHPDLLAEAVEDGTVSQAAAEEAVGGKEKYDEMYPEDEDEDAVNDAYDVDDHDSPSSSNTAQDEVVYGGEEAGDEDPDAANDDLDIASSVSLKRTAEDADETASSKKARTSVFQTPA